MAKIFPVEVVEKDDDFKNSGRKISNIFNSTNNLDVQNEKDEQKGIKLGADIKEGEKLLKNKQEYFIGGAQETVKRVKGLFKPYFDDLKASKLTLNNKMTAYRNMIEEKNRIAEEKRQAEIEKQNDEMVKAMENGESIGDEVSAIPEVEDIKKTKTTKAGKVTYRQIKKWKIVDESLIPREYLKVDTAKIEKSKHAGIEIAGIEFYMDKSVAW